MSMEKSFIPVPVDFTNSVLSVASVLRSPDICVVGGAVRDCVLGKLSGHETLAKDLDVILPAPLKHPEKNPNIVGMRKNSLGGAKLYIKNIGVVDVFQHYTENPESIIAGYFDFNCNSLYYRMHDNAIRVSGYFLEFLESKTIRPQNVCFVDNGVEMQYGIPQMVMRAIKFQIQFMEKFNIQTELSSDILAGIYNMTATDEENMKKYMASHVGDTRLKQMILQRYKKIRG